MGTRRSLGDSVFSAAKRLPWRKKEPNSDEDKAKIKKRLTESMEEASKYNKSKDHDKAIESYESALEDAKDLFDYDDDDETYYTPRKHRNKVIVDIIERLAETYLLNGNAEEALALYTDLKEDYADRQNSRRFKVLFKKEMYAMEKVNEQQRRKLKTEFDQLYQLGQINIKIGSWDKARTCFQKAMNIVKMKFGVTHEYVLLIREQLADIHVMKDELDEACGIYQSILPLLREKYGREDSKTLAVAGKLREINERCLQRK
mmetsp:Transcript_16116/g.21089  ORF Transcript_16116/g.21089 Transcript_16116/m.21089 type:complete len:260 (-) Transcript_16116:276-1055(-)|eukprot:CAMPEP_0116065814 /NCGR_PEP_ID=MMETSP0322-20121206/10012_1 /TAXON_ID=163516 /ORGANISM="Leptocylindrus danicus var. apora, Strain B651" /LENGTH=259 /DNA_ID=CAMNT_0003552251 /DNA_START=249 /DNA_END=1028 /DNA_ORIENTATION=-